METDAIEAGVPKPIVDWVLALPKNKNEPYFGRLNRFVIYWRRHPDDLRLAKAWRQVSKAALNQNALISFFALMPDEPTTQPYPAIFGQRVIDPGAEKVRYEKRLAQVLGVVDLLNVHRSEFNELMQDAASTPEGAQAAFAFRSVDQGMVIALKRLATLLEKVDPFAKIPTKHWRAEDAAVKVYASQVADLAVQMASPSPWTAIATLANINCEACTLTASALQKSSIRKDDKTR